MRNVLPRLRRSIFVLLCSAALANADDLVQVRQDFNKDPGWEAVNNRIIGVDGPIIKQDFGWKALDDGTGAVGGVVWSGITPACYGMPIGQPHSLKQKLSASGKITIKHMDGRCGAYIGFYNSTRQGWRPWSSLTLQLGTGSSKMKPKGSGPQASALVVILPANWRSDGVSNDGWIPADGKPHRWSFAYDPEAKLPDGTVRSQVTVQIDDEQPFVGPLEVPNTREFPAIFDRFGIVNVQSYGESCEFYLTDLKVNGNAIDLTRDPGWDGQGNRVTYPAFSFHGRHDYGFMSTNWAGEAPGELGGIFWGTEVEDPTHGYYADDIGQLTLDDPISFSATACFIDGQPDSGMAIGYFNAKEVMTEMPKGAHGFPVNQSMGLFIEGPSSIGKQLMAYCSPRQKVATILKDPPVFQPTRERRRVAFSYDPKANDGIGRYRLKLDDKEYSVNLTPQQRSTGATFDRFGVMNLRGGGKCVIVYYDDITYTARRGKDHKPVHHKQESVKVPYPGGGRRY